MAIINSKSYAKFDALIRADKASSLMSFIIGSYNSANKNELALRLKFAYDLFKIKGSQNYGSEIQNINYDSDNLSHLFESDEYKKVLGQFESHYTMGYEMGIWKNKDLELCEMAKNVAEYKVTVREYIGIVFLNLFTYYESTNNTYIYHHFLYEVLKKIIEDKLDINQLKKEELYDVLPQHDKQKEQFNILFNYLIATNFFEKIDNNTMKYCFSETMTVEELLNKCNLEYKFKSKEDAYVLANDKELYSKYITTNPLDFKSDNIGKTSKKYFSTIQKIYYGAPGTGKSYSVAQLIEEEKSKYKEVEVIRTTVYQDYSYYDFIGSIQPKVENDIIKYEFAPGPFSVALKKAIQNKDMQVYLIIEEMSRGNIASIFGDTFQLLDRKNGISEYSIHNELIANYVHLKQKENSKVYELNHEKVADPNNKMEHGIIKVSLPSNLHIIGTVNTSDQNVNVMDTAFKRRFSFEYVSVDPQEKDGKYLNNFTFTLDGDKFNWIRLYTSLNKFIVEKLGLSEDKQIGQFFIKFDNSSSDEDNKKQIGDKLLQYLWEDVQNAAISEVSLFKSDIKTFGQLYDYFNKKDKNIFSESLMELYNQNPITAEDKVEEDK